MNDVVMLPPPSRHEVETRIAALKARVPHRRSGDDYARDVPRDAEPSEAVIRLAALRKRLEAVSDE